MKQIAPEMIELIKQTKAFKALQPLSQMMLLKRVNRLQLEDQIIIARTIGLEKWRTISPLQERWKAIVDEIINNETNA